MVRPVIILLLLLCGSLAHAAGIELHLPGPVPHTAELGRAFTVQLDYRGETDLERIPLDSWLTDFAVDRGYARREGIHQRLRLRLTARRTGLLALSSLQLGSASSDPVTVKVTAATEGGEALDPRWQVSDTDAWQGQEIVASLSLDSRNPDLRLQTAEPHWSGFTVRALPPARELLADGRTRYRHTWLLRALHVAEPSLTAPELRLLRDGIPVRRFHFPQATVAIRVAPAYLPPTVPVGRLAAETDRRGRHWLLGRGVPAELLQTALDRAGLQHSGITERHTPEGTFSRARIDWGSTQADRARLVYFEPVAGRLQQLDLAAPPLPPVLWLLPLALGLAVWLAWQSRRISAWLRRLAEQRRLLQRLAGVSEPGALKAALLDRRQTLSGWLADWQSGFHAPPELALRLSQLEAACYGREAAAEELGSNLRQALRCCRPRW